MRAGSGQRQRAVFQLAGHDVLECAGRMLSLQLLPGQVSPHYDILGHIEVVFLDG